MIPYPHLGDLRADGVDGPGALLAECDRQGEPVLPEPLVDVDKVDPARRQTHASFARPRLWSGNLLHAHDIRSTMGVNPHRLHLIPPLGALTLGKSLAQEYN